MKAPDDEELEKLFEGLNRKTAKKIDNQHTPTKKMIKKIAKENARKNKKQKEG